MIILLDKMREKTRLLSTKMKIQNETIAKLRCEVASLKQESEVKPRLERNREIYIARENGARFVDLAIKYQLSSARVREIYLREKRIVKFIR